MRTNKLSVDMDEIIEHRKEMHASGHYRNARELALDLATFLDGTVVWLVDREEFAAWNGQRWEIVGKTLRGQYNAWECYLSTLMTKAGRHEASYASGSGVATILAAFARHPETQLDSQALDHVRDGLATPESYITLRDGIHRELSLLRYTSHITSVSPTHDKPVKWLQFINEITCGDTDLAAYLQLCAGYSLSGATDGQAFFLCHGSGANGKSLFVNTLQNIMGDYAGQAAAETLLLRPSSPAVYSLAQFPGKRMVVLPELPGGRDLNADLLKQLTGGDQVTGRHPAGRPFNFHFQGKLWITTNTLPQFSGTLRPVMRRLIALPFRLNLKLREQDMGLEQRLRGEHPAILQWMIDGATRYFADPLLLREYPDCVRDLNERIMESAAQDKNRRGGPEVATAETNEVLLVSRNTRPGDLVATFVEHCCEETEQEFTQASVLYLEFTRFCKRQRRMPLTAAAFGRLMNALNIPHTRKSDAIYYALTIKTHPY